MATQTTVTTKKPLKIKIRLLKTVPLAGKMQPRGKTMTVNTVIARGLVDAKKAQFVKKRESSKAEEDPDVTDSNDGK